MGIKISRSGEKPWEEEMAPEDRRVIPEKKREISEIPETPKSRNRKVSVTIRLDPEILDFFDDAESGWQTRLNDMLLMYVRSKKLTG